MMSGQERVGLIEPAHAVGGELYLVALEAQRALEDLRDLLVVLDDEHAHGTAGGIHRLYVTRRPAERPSFSRFYKAERTSNTMPTTSTAIPRPTNTFHAACAPPLSMSTFCGSFGS